VLVTVLGPSRLACRSMRLAVGSQSPDREQYSIAVGRKRVR